MSTDNTVWLTQGAYDRLQAELEQLTTVGRKEIAARIEAAREEGDLKENGGYHAAKDEQGKMEARIRELTELLQDAVVTEAPESAGVVEVGTVVTVSLLGKEMTFLLGSREIADGTELQVYSPESPLGKAILGLEIGAESSYAAPNGNTIAVKVLGVETFRG